MRARLLAIFALVFLCVLVWSGSAPRDRFTWWLEVAPALLAAPILALTYRRFPLTTLAYTLVLLHAIILMVGGHYTYAEVPLFDRLSAWMGWSRNNFDKLGHFAQGFVPALIAREVFIRFDVVPVRAWRNVLIVALCLAISALYELVEWLVAVLSGTDAEAFLGTQGYVWDTQSDMALALVGAISSLLLLARFHDRQLRELSAPRS
ncbi:MAG TPA: DUF2238 domain-containing protein [Planctomycetes bacterium]|nr:DUF2238 domain-containing protein [Planctomycetota bacterium]